MNEPTRALLNRMIPAHADRFQTETIPDEDGRDVFEIECDGESITLRGSSPVAAASALRWFLHYYCRSHVSWHADHISLPASLPTVDRVRITSPYRYRYYFNYCAFSYSTAFWDWPRWEREIDWMALHGINAPLSVTGQEGIWRSVLRAHGLGDEDAASFFVGPAYLPFGWMGCIDRWGGPLPDSWIDKHLELQRQIFQRERELGMSPVLLGFTGHFPRGLLRRYPKSRFHEIEWAAPDFGPTVLLDPLDPLFLEIGKQFVAEQIREFGTSHLYAADTFIEMTPPSDDPKYLADLAQAIYRGMEAADPQAVWVLQGWAFYFKRQFWRTPQVEAFLGAIPGDRVLILDLWAEEMPLWRKTRAFHGKPWIWCMLHNFGGRPGLFGKLKTIAEEPPRALADPGAGNMVGIGLTMEAIENNPIVYELMTEMAWRREPPDLGDWIKNYAHARYGFECAEIHQAWDILRRTVYASETSAPPQSVICARPSLKVQGLSDEHTEAVWTAWSLLLAGARSAAAAGPLPEPLRYDLVDVGREAMSRLAHRLYRDLTRSFAEGNREEFDLTSNRFLALIADLDRLLGTHPAFLLGTWINRARSWATTPEEAAHYEWNARNLITLWGPKESRLHDYSCRHWAGLVGTFYLPRWERFMAALRESLERPQSFDQAAFERSIISWEEGWTRQTGGIPDEPAGDLMSVCEEVYAQYAPLVPGANAGHSERAAAN